MFFVNDRSFEYSDGMTVSALVSMLRGINDFKKYFIYENTYAIIIGDRFIEREDYDKTLIEDGADITLRGTTMGG